MSKPSITRALTRELNKWVAAAQFGKTNVALEAKSFLNGPVVMLFRDFGPTDPSPSFRLQIDLKGTQIYQGVLPRRAHKAVGERFLRGGSMLVAALIAMPNARTVLEANDNAFFAATLKASKDVKKGKSTKKRQRL